MQITNQHELQRYLFWFVIVVVVGFAAIMVLPFVGAIISGYILAYLARPLQKVLKQKLKLSAPIASFLCVVTAVLLIVVPVTFVGLGIAQEAGDALQDKSLTFYFNSVFNRSLVKNFQIDVGDTREKVFQAINDGFASLLLQIPHIVIGIIVALLGMFFFLCDWENLSEKLKKYLPFKNKERLVRELDQTTHAIVFGALIVAIVEFFVSYVGFSLAGIQTSLILASVIFVLAFLPSFGPITIWGPLALYFAAVGQYQTALIVLITGLILTLGVEIYLYTKWVGDHSRLHPFVMLLGIIGGISVFGIFGFVIGPLVLANTIEIIESAMEPI